MIKFQDYEQEFNQLEISQRDACILLDYMQALAEIGIRFINEKKVENDEKLCDMDESIN